MPATNPQHDHGLTHNQRPSDAPDGATEGLVPVAGLPESDLPEEIDEELPPEKGPMRRCIVTRESAPKEMMLRFVLGPNRELVPDLAARLPGRGMWLSARRDVLERAVSRGAFAKAARGPVHLPPDLRERIEDALAGRIRDLLGFARRAGQVVNGFQQVREWLQANRAGLLLEASDGSVAERERLVGRRKVPVVTSLPAVELGAVFGRDHAVHVAVAPGRLADNIALEAARLRGVSGASDTPTA
ncbi:RNA-binding protein [Acetobacteraceae bacterium H6797]|nr:RNA-binding protein [Acetobacteraceae bacterium H6797]